MAHLDLPIDSDWHRMYSVLERALLQYLRERVDHLPLTEPEQVLSLALMDAQPVHIRQKYGTGQTMHRSWVVASAVLVRLDNERNGRGGEGGRTPRFHPVLDHLAAHAPGTWIEIYGAAEDVIDPGGDDPA